MSGCGWLGLGWVGLVRVLNVMVGARAQRGGVLNVVASQRGGSNETAVTSHSFRPCTETETYYVGPEGHYNSNEFKTDNYFSEICDME